jgi:hypothetical protein
MKSPYHAKHVDWLKSTLILTNYHTKGTHMSKGSNPRPVEIPREKFRDNWDQIFGKNSPKPPEKQPPAK